jgi:hypothetical protein
LQFFVLFVFFVVTSSSTRSEVSRFIDGSASLRNESRSLIEIG